MLHTIDIDPHLKEMVNASIARAGMQDRIVTHLAPALEIIPTLPGPFDLVFIDADKPNYPNYFHAVMDRVRPGGLIIADNVLWSGKVADPTATDPETVALREFNAKVYLDHRVDLTTLAVADGMTLARVR